MIDHQEFNAQNLIKSNDLGSMSSPESDYIGDVLSTSSSNNQLRSESLDFVKGINLNGDSVTIEGNQWLSEADALNDGLVIKSGIPASYSLGKRINADPDTRDMLEDMLLAGGGSRNISLSQEVENGQYQVDLWYLEPISKKRSFDVEIEGVTLDRVDPIAKGKWQKLSYQSTIEDGKIDVNLKHFRKKTLLSGIEFSKMSGDGPMPPGNSNDETPPTPPISPIDPAPPGPQPAQPPSGEDRPGNGGSGNGGSGNGNPGSGNVNIGKGYDYGILPRNADIADAKEAYEDWKDLYVTNKGVPNRSNMLRISHMVDGKGRSSGEFQGYGMLFAAHLEADDTVLEKLWNYAEHYLNGDGLMPWDISATGVVEGPGAALDGDMDIAMALDYAARRWPGKGWDKRAETYIDNMLKPAQRSHLRNDTLSSADWPRYKKGEYLNYLATGYMERFSERTGDDRWVDITIPNSYELMEYSFDNFDLPAWFVDINGKPVQPKDPWSSKLNRHDAGAIRTDWRIATHYLSSGHKDAKKWSDKLSNFFDDAGRTTKSGKTDEFSPTNLRSGYRFTSDRNYQAGDGYGTRATAESMMTAAGVTAMASGNVEMTNSIYDFLDKDPIERDDKAMDNAMQVMGLLIMSGGLNSVK